MIFRNIFQLFKLFLTTNENAFFKNKIFLETQERFNDDFDFLRDFFQTYLLPNNNFQTDFIVNFEKFQKHAEAFQDKILEALEKSEK